MPRLGSKVVMPRTANPLCAGSIPAPASIWIFLLFFISNIAFAVTPGNQNISFGNQLIDAADKGQESQIISLIKSGISPNVTGNFGVTPLMRAAFNGHIKAMESLIMNGADVNAADKGGATALHLASRQGHKEAVALLIKYDAQIDKTDSEGWTPLMRASLAKKEAVVKFLIEKGADVKITNQFGESSLMHAAQSGSVESVKEMLAKGADINQRNKSGSTALSLALRKGHNDVTKILNEKESPKIEPIIEPVIAAAPVSPVMPKEIAKETKEEKLVKSKVEEPIPGLQIEVKNKPKELPKEEPKIFPTPIEKPKEPKVIPEIIKESKQPEIKTEPKPEIIKSAEPKAKPVKEIETLPWVASPPKPVIAPKKEEIENPAPRLKSKANYFVQLGTFNSEEEANRYWNNIKAPALSPYIYRSGDKKLELRGGIFKSDRDAKNFCKNIRARGEECFVIESYASPQENVLQAKSTQTEPREEPKPQENREIIEEQKETPEKKLPWVVKKPAENKRREQPKTSWNFLDILPVTGDEKPKEEIKKEEPIVSIPPKIEKKPEITKEAPIERREVIDLPKVEEFEPSKALVEEKPLPHVKIEEKAKVTVSEAIRVPVTTPLPQRKNPDFFAPSDPESVKGQWLEFYGFKSDDEALALGDKIHSENDGVRIRIIKSGLGRDTLVKLRIGPFNNKDSGDICDKYDSYSISCRKIEEMGSFNIIDMNKPMRGGLNRGSEIKGTYESSIKDKDIFWMQLGSYEKETDALDEWNRLKSLHSDIFAGISPNIITPKRGSHSIEIFHLRAGPYYNEEKATQACAMLEKRNRSCFIIETKE